jgi:hypothetical protein
MDGIFISYRRDDSAGYAGRLYDRLAAHFGAERVFMDVEGIEPGTDFVEAIEAAVSSCQVLIVIIGDEWTRVTDAAGRRRLDDPNDFIRLETGAALQRGIRVVPVLVEGAVMPLADELPAELKSLTRRQAIEVSHKQWESSTGELIRTLEGILSNKGAGSATTPKTPVSGGQMPVAEKTPAAPAPIRAWAVPAVLLLAALAGGGLWLGFGERGGERDGAHDGDMPPKLADPVAVHKPVPEAAPEKAPGTADVPVSAPVPAEKPSATDQPDAVRLAEDKPAGGERLPVPVPVPERASAPMVPPAGSSATPTAVTPAPVIRSFRVDAGEAGMRLCYRVSNAERLTLSPRPGELANPDQDCVSVDVERATTFTLIARNADKVVRRTLAVSPRPAAVRPAAPAAPTIVTDAPPAATTPTVVEPARAAVSTLPLKGERWTYRSSGKWPTSPRRRIEVVVQSVEGEVVTEVLRVLEPASERGSEERRSRGRQPDFVAWSGIGIEFGPYFGAFVDLAGQRPLSGVSTPDLTPLWRQWFSSVKVLGRESVSVPAGTFDAYKVEVWSNRFATGDRMTAGAEPVRVHYLVWYAPQAKRYVKMRRQIAMADSSEGELDVFELVSHTPP